MSDTPPMPEGIMTTESVPLAYDQSATIVITTNNSHYSPAPERITARDASNHYTKAQRHTTLSQQVDELVEYLTENYSELEMHADEIAKIFDRQLEKEVSVTVVVEFDLTMTLPVGASVEDELDMTSFSVEGFGTEIEVDDHRIVRFLER